MYVSGIEMSNEKKGPWLFRLYRGLYYPVLWGILISQYKDPYKPTSIMESRRVCFLAQMNVCGYSKKMTMWPQ